MFLIEECVKFVSTTFKRVYVLNTISKQIRQFYYDYRSELVFGLVLCVLLVVSYWLATFIPEDMYTYMIDPAFTLSMTVGCFWCGWLMLRHLDGNGLRRSWAGVSFYFICICFIPNRLFTQQWFLFFMLMYTTEQVLFRPDPWLKLQRGYSEEYDDPMNYISASEIIPPDREVEHREDISAQPATLEQ